MLKTSLQFVENIILCVLEGNKSFYFLRKIYFHVFLQKRIHVLVFCKIEFHEKMHFHILCRQIFSYWDNLMCPFFITIKIPLARFELMVTCRR